MFWEDPILHDNRSNYYCENQHSAGALQHTLTCRQTSTSQLLSNPSPSWPTARTRSIWSKSESDYFRTRNRWHSLETSCCCTVSFDRQAEWLLCTRKAQAAVWPNPPSWPSVYFSVVVAGVHKTICRMHYDTKDGFSKECATVLNNNWGEPERAPHWRWKSAHFLYVYVYVRQNIRVF